MKLESSQSNNFPNFDLRGNQKIENKISLIWKNIESNNMKKISYEIEDYLNSKLFNPIYSPNIWDITKIADLLYTE